MDKNSEIDLAELDFELDPDYVVNLQAKLEAWANGLNEDLEALLGEELY